MLFKSSCPAIRYMLWLPTTLCAWCAATFPFSTCKYSYIARQTFTLNGGNIKWGKGKILQRALERVIYTSEKLYDVYDSYSRIIYSFWPWQSEFHDMYFSSFFWRVRRSGYRSIFLLKHWNIGLYSIKRMDYIY